MLRISDVQALDGFKLRLTLTNGEVMERDVKALLRGTLFAPILRDPDLFRKVHVADGTVEWPNGADLCPDVLIWGGPPPVENETAALAGSVHNVSL